jgi:hypothetical protein
VALTVSLGAFADADNLSFVIGTINSGSNINWTPETNWTSIQDVGTTGVQTATAYRGVEDTSPSIISADNGYVPYAVFGVEVKQAAGGVEATATPGRSLLVATSDVGGYYL